MRFMRFKSNSRRIWSGSSQGRSMESTPKFSNDNISHRSRTLSTNIARGTQKSYFVVLNRAAENFNGILIRPIAKQIERFSITTTPSTKNNYPGRICAQAVITRHEARILQPRSSICPLYISYWVQLPFTDLRRAFM